MAFYPHILIGQIPIFLMGLAVVQLAWKGTKLADWLIKIFLAEGIGLGLDACLYFLWSLAFSPFNPLFYWLEALLALGAVVYLILAFIKRRRVPAPVSAPPTALWPLIALAVAFGGVALLTSAAYALSLYSRPSGSFDAYAIWNLRARFMFYSPSDWTAAFSPLINWKAHTDYPLLWPMNLLRTWLLVGRDTPEAAIVQTAIFYAIIPGVTFGGLLKLRGWGQALLGGILLLGMPAYLNYSTFQAADAALVFFYLAALFLLLLSEKENSPGLLALAGLCAGLAGWTKNEGILFAGAVLVYVLVRSVRRPLGPGLSWLRRLAPFGLGLALPLAVTFAFKAVLAPPGDLIGAQSGAEMLAKILDPSRYLTISRSVLTYLPTLGGWSWPVAIAIPAYALAAGKTKSQSGWLAWIILGITFLGYFGVYLITPHPLEWHLQYSLDRLMFQLLVPTLFLMLALIRSPEELLNGRNFGK
jgi:hypothetical protein